MIKVISCILWYLRQQIFEMSLGEQIRWQMEKELGGWLEAHIRVKLMLLHQTQSCIIALSSSKEGWRGSV